MGAEFRSHFVFILLVGTALLDKSHSWIYYEKHHRKKSYERYCSDSKNYRLRKVKSGKVVLYSLLEFSEAVNDICSVNLYHILTSKWKHCRARSYKKEAKLKEMMKIHKLERKT